MNDVNDHLPTPEFRAHLRSDVLRSFRSHELFRTTAVPSRARRVALVAGLAAATVLTLGIGMVLGASISYASAAVPDAPRPAIAILPIGNAINALRCGSGVAPQSPKATVASAQSVPVVDVSLPTAKTSIKLGAMLGLKETSDGWVVVEDAGRHQVRLFEPSLATSTVVLDSAPGSAKSYGQGNVPRPLIPYLGDSSLFADDIPKQMLVLDGRGQVGRAMALVSVLDEMGLARGHSGVDPKGRIHYLNRVRVAGSEGSRVTSPNSVTVPFGASLLPQPARPDAVGRDGGAAPSGIRVTVDNGPDSLAIHRLDLDTRRIDTVAYVMRPADRRDENGNGGGKLVAIYGKDGAAVGIKQLINPLRAIDEWAVLSDGTIGVVRGRDYHVDWIHPDGTRSSSPKLPFDWKRLTDDDKQRLVDSTHAALDSLEAWATRRANGTPAPTDSIAAIDSLKTASSARVACGSVGLRPVKCPPGRRQWPYETVPFSEISDYWPPFREHAALADRDGNMWILPNTTALSKQGELIYDVVNPKQGLVRRVRLPVGRSIAGFGKGGVVYLQAGDIKTGFTLERTTIAGVKLGSK